MSDKIAVYAMRGTNNQVTVNECVIGEKGTTIHYTHKGEKFKKGLNKFKKQYYHLSGVIL